MNNETTKYIAPAAIFKNEIAVITEKLKFESIIIEVTKDEGLLGYLVLTHPRATRTLDRGFYTGQIVRMCTNLGHILRVFSTTRCHARFRLVESVIDVCERVVIFESVEAFLDEFNISKALSANDNPATWRPLISFLTALEKGTVRSSHPAVRDIHYPTSIDSPRVLRYTDKFNPYSDDLTFVGKK